MRWLRTRGVDVLYAQEERGLHISDSELLARALIENRFVLTHDTDFGELAVLKGEPYYGIICLRPGNRPPSAVIADLAELSARNIQWERGMLAIFRNGRLRIRRTAVS